MPTPFDDIDAKGAHDIVKQNGTKGRSGRDWYEENKAFIGFTTGDDEIDIDHWQGGKGFVAPMPNTRHPLHSTVTSAWKSAFVTENIMGEMAERRKSGAVGKMPEFRFEFDGMEDEDDEEEVLDEQGNPIPANPESQARRDRLKAIGEAMHRWFEDKKGLRVLRKFALGLSAGAKCYLRMYLPADRFVRTVTNEEGQSVQVYDFSVATPEEALQHIYVECVDRQAANLIVHRPTMRQIGVIAFEVSRDEAEAFRSAGQGGQLREGMKWAELTYIDPDTSQTIIRIVYDSEDRPDVQVSANLGGRLTLFEGNEPLYLDEGIRSNQRDLNTTRTQLRISNDNTAFTRLIVMNAQPPTTEETDATTGKKVLKIGEETGPGKVTYLAGYKFTGEDGKLYITTPDVHEVQPPDNEGIIKSLTEARSALYRLGKQAHMLIAGDAATSGEARIQAQADFMIDLSNLKSVIDEAGRWMIETVWWFANHLSGSVVDDGLRGVFEARLDPGHISDGLRRHIIERVDKGLLSKRMAMSMLGTDDVDAEIALIRREREEDQPELETLQIERARLAIDRERLEDPEDIQQRRNSIEAAAAGGSGGQ